MLRFFSLLLLLTPLGLWGQIRAKAISYEVQIDLDIFDPDYANQTDAENKVSLFEVDVYYTDKMVKTFSRAIDVPEDYDLLIAQRFYAIDSKDEYQIIAKDSYILHKRNQVTKLRKTGQTKKLLGYQCREYVFADHRGVQFNVWVADGIQRNLCPAGNFGLKGTALEVTASNGIHYLATDFAEGELPNGFFGLPQGFKTETIDLAATK